jgi:hypothetical protein
MMHLHLLTSPTRALVLATPTHALVFRRPSESAVGRHTVSLALLPVEDVDLLEGRRLERVFGCLGLVSIGRGQCCYSRDCLDVWR